MPDTLAPRTPPRDRAATSAAVRLAAIGAPLLTAGVALAAAWAGVSPRVQLPNWWGPWPWRTGSSRDGYVVAGIVLLGMLCVLWTWLAAAVLSLRESLPTRGVAAVAAACAVPLALGGSVGSLDVQSYAAIGRLAAIGLDPYRATTGWLGDRYSAAVDPLWRWTPTPYGPLQVALLRGLVGPAGDQVGTAVLLIRSVAVLALVAAVVLAARAAGCSGRVPVLVVTAINPVVLVHVVSGAHLDVLIGLLALLVVALSRGNRPGLAVVLAVMACGIKLPGAVLVAFVLLDVVRRTSAGDRVRVLARTFACALVTTAAITLLCRDPFGWVPALPVPGIVHNGAAPSTWVSYLVGGLTDSLVGSGLDSAFTVGRTFVGAVGVALAVVLLWRAASPGSTRHALRGVGWALVAVAASGPAFYPWYLAWGLFAAAAGSGPRGRFLLVVLGSVSCIAAALGEGTWVLLSWLVFLLAVLGLSAWLARAWLVSRPDWVAP
jgi:alpha-1,6-mannosyltransferase